MIDTIEQAYYYIREGAKAAENGDSIHDCPYEGNRAKYWKKGWLNYIQKHKRYD